MKNNRVGTARFAPVETRRAFEEICVQIRSEIQSGLLSPGDKLPAERELAQQFQVSRSTVREALRMLEIGGVLKLYKGAHGGAVVQEGRAEPITRTMQDLLSLGGVSLKDFTEARVCLQSEIIKLACERASEEDLQALEQNVSKTKAVDASRDPEARTELNVEFYSLLADATKNSAMKLLMSAFTEPLSYYIRQIGPDRSWDVAESRRKFVKHLRDRDAESATAEMANHMSRLHDYMLSNFEEEKPDS